VTVTAFVLTRDRKHLLTECLRALIAQTHPIDEIVVLDNASSDGTKEHLERNGLLQHVRFERSETNLGGAGGFREGIRLLEGARDWLWLMDDDAEPRPDALQRLVDAPVEGPRCAKVIRPDGSIDRQHRCTLRRFVEPLGEAAYSGYAKVDCASFVGLLLPQDAARRAGLPRAEFFLGFDDAEYSLRLGEIRLVPESVVVHKAPIGGAVMNRRARAVNRILGLTYAPTPPDAFWRDLLRVRNFMWLKHRHQRVTKPEFALLTAGYLAKSALYDPQPWRRAPHIVRYAVKGRRGEWS
jgi:GT2 family glycosyltransferase